MVKRLLLITAFLILSNKIAEARTALIPEGSAGALATSDYGGVDYSTGSTSLGLINLSSQNVLCFKGEGVFQGLFCDSMSWVSAPTGSAPPYILIRDTESVLNSGATWETADSFRRIYISTLATSSSYNNYALDGGIGVVNWEFKPVHPIRVKRGLAIKCSVNTINGIRAYFTKFGQE